MASTRASWTSSIISISSTSTAADTDFTTAVAWIDGPVEITATKRGLRGNLRRVHAECLEDLVPGAHENGEEVAFLRASSSPTLRDQAAKHRESRQTAPYSNNSNFANASMIARIAARTFDQSKPLMKSRMFALAGAVIFPAATA